jgi:transcriptional regulator with XRE-family HTH domain
VNGVMEQYSGEALARLRKSRGMAAYRVEKLTGVSRGVILRIEAGAQIPNVATIGRLLSCYNARLLIAPCEADSEATADESQENIENDVAPAHHDV